MFLRRSKTKIKFQKVKNMNNKAAIFIIHKSTDCDHCTSTRSKSFKTREELDQYIEEAWQNSEGSQQFTEITEKQFKAFKPSFRDGILEAFENGHQHIVRSN